MIILMILKTFVKIKSVPYEIHKLETNWETPTTAANSVSQQEPSKHTGKN